MMQTVGKSICTKLVDPGKHSILSKKPFLSGNRSLVCVVYSNRTFHPRSPSSITTSEGTTNTSHIMVSNLSKLANSFLTGFTSQSTVDSRHLSKFDMLKPLREWLDNLKISNPRLAHKLCQLIPSQCPFERDLNLFGRTLVHIPPMCKLNPLYEEVVTLRFKAMCYLADECGEDISQYC
jgi:hypothetical protein